MSVVYRKRRALPGLLPPVSLNPYLFHTVVSCLVYVDLEVCASRVRSDLMDNSPLHGSALYPYSLTTLYFNDIVTWHQDAGGSYKYGTLLSHAVAF